MLSPSTPALSSRPGKFATCDVLDFLHSFTGRVEPNTHVHNSFQVCRPDLSLLHLCPRLPSRRGLFAPSIHHAVTLCAFGPLPCLSPLLTLLLATPPYAALSFVEPNLCPRDFHR